MSHKVRKSDSEWRRELTPEQYRVMREKGTEAPFSGIYVDTDTPGLYRCAGCGEALFSSDTKYHSGSGWPSFWAPLESGRIEQHEDQSLGMRRIEIACAGCGAHLGHVFPDGPQPTGQRFCVNSAALTLDQEE